MQTAGSASLPARTLPASRGLTHEIAGGFGDVGVFLPLALGLIAVNGMNPTLVFGLAGAYYIVSGRLYGLPMPVQPLKAVSAIAIASGLSAGTIQGAALGMSAGLLLLSLGRLPAIIDRIFQPPVVRGIQLGLGIILLQGGLQLVLRDPRLPSGTGPYAALALLTAGVIGVALVQARTRLPAILVVVAVGVVWGLLTMPALAPAVPLGPILVLPALPTPAEMGAALVVLVLPQLPLTLGNSVVSTADVAREYFGAVAARVTPRTLLRDMGLANLVAGLGGGIPMCHGAGGLTAHVRLGARTSLAAYAAGAFYLLLGLGFGAAATGLLALFPMAILGVLVGYVGWQHLQLVRRLSAPADLAVAGLIGAVTLVVGSLALGFGVGLAAYWGRRLLMARRDRRAPGKNAPRSRSAS
jgi:SulP family sulfate permease